MIRAALAAAAVLALSGCMSVNVETTVTREVVGALAMEADVLAALPRAEASVTLHGETHRFSGPLLIDAAGTVATFQRPVRGEDLGLVVLVTGRDGYQAAFGLGELDPATSGRTIILADQMDGQALPAEDGPWRIVAADDVRGARMVRMVERIAVVRP